MDRVRIHVRAGSGGQGSARLGAPGGNGGDVVAEADERVSSLLSVSRLRRLHAGSGDPGISRGRGIKGEGKVWECIALSWVLYRHTVEM